MNARPIGARTDRATDPWSLVGTWLERAIRTRGSERDLALDQAISRAPEHEAQIRAIMQASDGAPSLLDGNGCSALSSLWAHSIEPASDTPPLPGLAERRVGAYRLEAEIGRGGMGIVYRAVRADGLYEQRVAIKLLKSRTDSRLVGRFRHERRALAALDHPNVARMLDAGFDDEGLPYLVMEHVVGVPIAEFCEQHKLSIAERLVLLRKLAAGIEHAHRNLIVHRDIKSSNVLVTPDGEPKILDFGIVKLLEVNDDLTNIGESALSPSNAAPEQIRGAAVTVQTDVYQLGLLAYRLLTGLPAHERMGSFYETARRVLEREPALPSRAVQTARGAVALRRTGLLGPRDDPGRIARRLRGDLDAMLMKALAIDPAGRYGSVEALAADLSAHCETRPVAARGPDRAYRFWRFVVRRRMSIALASVLVVTLGAYATTSIVQSRRLAESLVIAESERLRAEQVSSFVVEVFERADPLSASTGDVDLNALLEAAREKADEALPDSLQTRAAMYRVLGELNYSLGRYGESAALFEAALDLLPDEARTTVAPLLTKLGMSYVELDRLEEALGSYDAAIAAYRAAGITTEPFGEALNARGLLLRTLARTDEARRSFDEAIGVLAALPDGPTLELPTARNNLATLEADLGHNDAAAAGLRRALAEFEQLVGASHPLYARTLGNLAAVLIRTGHLAEAQAHFIKVLGLLEARLGVSHPSLLATLWGLGKVTSRLGRAADGEKYLRRALTIARTAYGDDATQTASALARLGEALMDDGRTESAVPLVEEALRIDRAAFPFDHPRIDRDLALLSRATGLAEPTR